VRFEIKIDVFFFLFCSSEKVSSAMDINTRTPVKIVLDSYYATGNHSYDID
jgi:hypothetical protein